MEIKITIPKEKEQRVLDGYDVDNAADLKLAIISGMEEHIGMREYKKGIATVRESLTKFTL